MATASAGTGQAPKGKGSATHRAGIGPAFCSTWYAIGISNCRDWPGPPWTAPATPGHRGAARGHVSPWYQLRAAGKASSTR